MHNQWIVLSEAVQRIAGRLDSIRFERRARERKWDLKRAAATVAQEDLYETLRSGGVRSRAGVAHAEKGSTWALTDWSIPAFLWRVVTIHRYIGILQSRGFGLQTNRSHRGGPIPALFTSRTSRSALPISIVRGPSAKTAHHH
jgi:hypothetical protein